MSFQDYADDLERKSKVGPIKKQYLIGVAALIAVVLGCAGFHIYTSANASTFEVENASDSQASPTLIYVHVTGEVVSPGLIEIEEGSRVAAAIDKAGGATDDADLSSINLAAVLEDGEQIVVAAKANEEEAASSATGVVNGKVNINTANSETLQTISGIGPSKAQKIISYRETNGRFKTVDDLKNVSGFGDKTVDAIRDQICV